MKCGQLTVIKGYLNILGLLIVAFPLNFAHSAAAVTIGKVPAFHCAAALSAGDWIRNVIVGKENLHLEAHAMHPMNEADFAHFVQQAKEAAPTADFLNIANPSPELVKIAMAASKDQRGIIYGPAMNTWHAEKPSAAEVAAADGSYVVAMIRKAFGGNGGDRARRARKSWTFFSENIEARALNLGTEQGFSAARDAYAEWYKIYEAVVISKETGVRAAKPTLDDNFPNGTTHNALAPVNVDKSNFWFVPLYDKVNGHQLIGGTLFQYFPDTKIFKVKFTANLRELHGVDYSKHHISTASLDNGLRNIAPADVHFVSYGSDGGMVSTPGKQLTDFGLAKAKADWGFGIEWFNDPSVALIAQRRLLIFLRPVDDYDHLWVSGFEQTPDGFNEDRVVVHSFVGNNANTQSPPSVNPFIEHSVNLRNFVWDPR